MNVSIASRALTDPEIKRLAKAVCDRRVELAALPTNMKHRLVLGALLFVWEACYTRRSEYVDVETVDAVAELDGFLEAMVGCGLAEDPGPEFEGLWRICGVADRIRWLDKQEAKGRNGGISTAKRRLRDNELARAAAVALAQVQLDGQPLSNPEIPDLRDLIQKGCGQVDAVLARLYAVRSQLAIALKADDVPPIRSSERMELLATLEEVNAEPVDVDQAFAQVEQQAREARRIAGVDDLCAALRAGRAPARRAELRVVEALDDQVVVDANGGSL